MGNFSFHEGCFLFYIFISTFFFLSLVLFLSFFLKFIARDESTCKKTFRFFWQDNFLIKNLDMKYFISNKRKNRRTIKRGWHAVNIHCCFIQYKAHVPPRKTVNEIRLSFQNNGYGKFRSWCVCAREYWKPTINKFNYTILIFFFFIKYNFKRKIITNNYLFIHEKKNIHVELNE